MQRPKWLKARERLWRIEAYQARSSVRIEWRCPRCDCEFDRTRSRYISFDAVLRFESWWSRGNLFGLLRSQSSKQSAGKPTKLNHSHIRNVIHDCLLIAQHFAKRECAEGAWERKGLAQSRKVTLLAGGGKPFQPPCSHT